MYKILLLSPCDIFPPVHGSSTAIYNILKYLPLRNTVDALLCRLYSRRGIPNLSHANLRIHYARESPLDRMGYKGLPINPFYFSKARQLMASLNPDIVQAELLWTAPAALCLSKLFKKPVILVEENVEYIKFKRMGFSATTLSLIKHLERWACRTADAVIALSEVDRELLCELYALPREKVSIIPHCIDLETLSRSEEGAAGVRERMRLQDAFIVTFLGKLDYLPNERAVGFIAERIRPAVLARHPEVVFFIIGQNYEHLSLYADNHLHFTGFVDRRREITPNLVDYLSASDLVIVPLESGSGTRVKILEAAACACPIVSTGIGAEGLGFVDGEEIILTDRPEEEFIREVLRVIEDGELRKRISRGALQRVRASYDCATVLPKFQEIYDRLTCHSQRPSKTL